MAQPGCGGSGANAGESGQGRLLLRWQGSGLCAGSQRLIKDSMTLRVVRDKVTAGHRCSRPPSVKRQLPSASARPGQANHTTRMLTQCDPTTPHTSRLSPSITHVSHLTLTPHPTPVASHSQLAADARGAAWVCELNGQGSSRAAASQRQDALRVRHTRLA